MHSDGGAERVFVEYVEERRVELGVEMVKALLVKLSICLAPELLKHVGPCVGAGMKE